MRRSVIALNLVMHIPACRGFSQTRLFVPRSLAKVIMDTTGARRCDVLMTVTSEAGARAWPPLPIYWQITGPLHAVDARGPSCH